MVDVCLDAGVNMFDTADNYSVGESEQILGAAIKGRGDKVVISTETGFRVGDGLNDIGTSRYHVIEACERSLRRLATDHLDNSICTRLTR